jgi:HD-like signal output (HDOD) protein
LTEPGKLIASETTLRRDAFALGEILAGEVARGDIELPGFPPVALRVQKLLNDDKADVHDIAQAASLDPSFAMLVLRIANSAAFNTAGQQVKDLRSAVQRVGTRMVRAAALALVVQALRSNEELRDLRDRLGGVWRRGINVGSVAKAIAWRTGSAEPDAGLLVGLLHVVGRLYVLARMRGMPHLLEQDGLPEKLLDRWSDPVTDVLLLKWEVPREYYDAVVHFQNRAQPGKAGACVLGDVLTAANLLTDLLPPSRSDYMDQMQLAQVCQLHEPLLERLKLTREACSDAIHTALDEVQQLRALFGA